jgi:hypothetical protein
LACANSACFWRHSSSNYDRNVTLQKSNCPGKNAAGGGIKVNNEVNH